VILGLMVCITDNKTTAICLDNNVEICFLFQCVYFLIVIIVTRGCSLFFRDKNGNLPKSDLFPVLERDLEVPVYLSKVKQGYILRKI
jgi:hypothetical protein